MLDYVSGYDGSTVQLDAGSLNVGTAGSLRGRKWSYTLGHRGISGAVRSSREASVELASTDPAQLDRARRVFDRDVQAGAVGELVYAGEWRTAALVTASAPSTIYMGYASSKLTIVLIDGVWRRRHELYVPLPSTEPERGDLDYPYDYPYDLAKPVPSRRVDASGWGESAVGFVIYGPAAEPAIEIGGNIYQVLRDVGIGERVEVDGISRTVELVTAGGERVNVAGDAVRGKGYGGGSYIFQPLPPGGSEVIADGSFAFDVIWYDEEGEPPWSPS